MRAVSLEQCGKAYGEELLTGLKERRVEATPQQGINETLIEVDGKLFIALEGRFDNILLESLLKIGLEKSA